MGVIGAGLGVLNGSAINLFYASFTLTSKRAWVCLVRRASLLYDIDSYGIFEAEV